MPIEVEEISSLMGEAEEVATGLINRRWPNWSRYAILCPKGMLLTVRIEAPPGQPLKQAMLHVVAELMPMAELPRGAQMNAALIRGLRQVPVFVQVRTDGPGSDRQLLQMLISRKP